MAYLSSSFHMEDRKRGIALISIGGHRPSHRADMLCCSLTFAVLPAMALNFGTPDSDSGDERCRPMSPMALPRWRRKGLLTLGESVSSAGLTEATRLSPA